MERNLKKTMFLLLIGLLLFGEKRIVVRNGDIINFGQMMEDHNLFLKWCVAIDHDENSFYFLDRKILKVFRVDKKTGKLIKSISHRGQGPGEIQDPWDMRVDGGRVYILDKGFRGIKVFTVKGKLLREFKLRGSPGLKPSFDVEGGKIYVKEVYPGAGLFISLYSDKGKFVKKLVKIKGQFKDRDEYFRYNYSKLRKGKEGLYLLFPFLRELWKFDEEGTLLWKRKIEDEILSKYPPGEVKWSAKSVSFSPRIFDFSVDRSSGKILISHVGGGVLYGEDGGKIALITFRDEKESLRTIDFWQGSIITSRLGGYVKLIKLKMM